MRVGIAILGSAGCINGFNSTAELLLGYRASDVCGKPGVQIFGGIEKLLGDLGGLPVRCSPELPLKMSARHQDGQEIRLVGTAYAMGNHDGSHQGIEGVVLVFEAAEEQEELQQRLRHLNRLQSLDHFAAGIMHEIRNPLTAISTNAQYMMESLRAGERYYDEVRDIVADVHSIEEIVGRILDFAHPTKSQVREGPVEDIVEEVLRCSRATLRRQGVRLQVNLGKSTAKVRVDVSQIRQVFFNLIRNACEAMNSGGELRVSSSRSRAGSGRAVVCVEVTDTGSGIPEAHLPRIFDPFFSLHAGGTGLGLAISRKIVENHGGSIEVRSQPGKGSTFGVVLPSL